MTMVKYISLEASEDVIGEVVALTPYIEAYDMKRLDLLQDWIAMLSEMYRQEHERVFRPRKDGDAA